MCIAILNTKKAGKLPKSQIKNSWDNNNMERVYYGMKKTN